MVPIAATAKSFSHESGSSAIDLQAQLAGLNVIQLNIVTCLFPGFTAPDQLICCVVALPILIIFEVALTKMTGRRNDLVAVCSCVVQLLYMTLIGNAASMLSFDTMSFYPAAEYLLHKAGPLGATTITTLTSDRRIVTDGTWMNWIVVLATCVLVIVGCGAPLLFVITHKNMSTEESSRHFSFLTKNFTPQSWFWEAAVALRKALSITCFAINTTKDYTTTSQLHLYQLILVVYLSLFEQQRPTSSTLVMAERVSCWGAIVTASLLVIISTASTEVQQSSLIGGVFSAIQALSLCGVVYSLIEEARSSVQSVFVAAADSPRSGDKTAAESLGLHDDIEDGGSGQEMVPIESHPDSQMDAPDSGRTPIANPNKRLETRVEGREESIVRPVAAEGGNPLVAPPCSPFAENLAQ